MPSHIQEVEANPGSQEEEEEMVVEEEKTEKGKDSVLEAQEIAKKILGNNYSDGGRWIILGAIGGQWLATSVSIRICTGSVFNGLLDPDPSK